jgi:outer membrane protein assembly factor BamA
VRFLRLILLLSTSLFWACNPAKRLVEGEVFLRKNKVKYDEQGLLDIGTYSKEEATSVIRPKTNRKIIGFFRFNLWAYNLMDPSKADNGLALKQSKFNAKQDARAAKGKKRKEKEVNTFRSWVRYTVGEPPAVFDSLRMTKSAEQVGFVFEKNGYFRNEVSTEVKYFRKGRQARVTYHIKPDKPYRLGEVKYRFPDAEMEGARQFLTQEALLTRNKQFKVSTLDEERDRLTALLNNNGYFDFSKEFIRYEADSTVGNRTVNILMDIRPPAGFVSMEDDSLRPASHKKYSIRKIYVHTEFEPFSREYEPQDTLFYRGAYLLYNEKLKINPKLLHYTRMVEPGELFNKSKSDLTYRRFSRLGVFRSVGLRYNQTDNPLDSDLDCHIQLAQAKRRGLKLQTNATHRVGNLGLAGNLAFEHRNVFGGAERLEVRIASGFEAQQLLIDQSEEQQLGGEIRRQLRLNTFEVGPEVILSIPRFFPFSLDRFSRSNSPTTVFYATLNRQVRPDYRRTLNRIGYGYRFSETSTKTHVIELVEISVIKVQKSEAFENQLITLGDNFLLNSYRDHLIAATGYTYIYNTRERRRQRQHFFSSSSIEVAGNLLRAGLGAFNRPTNENGKYELLGIQFAQYIKGEQDFRYYRIFNERRQLVARFAAGAGRPLQNLSVLPFEKSFFGGGSIGVRAWKARTLGPGSYRDPFSALSFNNIGEIKVEANVEYRFKITGMFEGAWFADAGNIWLFKEDELRPGSGLEANTFLSEIAIGAGFGARLDFDFFLFRLDWGMQLKDPRKIPGERWIGQPKGEYNEYLKSISPDPLNPQRYFPGMSLHLAIGYPF